MTFDRLYPSKKLLQVEQHLRKVWAGEIPCTYSSLTSQSYYRGLRPREDMYRAAADFGDSVLFVPYLSPPRAMTGSPGSPITSSICTPYKSPAPGCGSF